MKSSRKYGPPKDPPGMTYERYESLMYDEGGELTLEELKLGWHFCPEWDFLLIHPSDPEAEVCGCNTYHKE